MLPGMAELATVTTTHLPGSRVALVTGEVDCSNAIELFAEIAESVAPDDRALVLDLTGCAYLDSAGIREILLVQRHLAERRQRLVLVLDASGAAHRVLSIVGALDHIPWHRTVDDAVRETTDR